MAESSHRAFATFLEIAGVFVLAWGILLMLTLGLSLEGLGASMLFGAYSGLLMTADRRAVALGWAATALMIAVSISGGMGPVLVLVSAALFVLSMFITDNRDWLL